MLPHAPGVQMQNIPADAVDQSDDEEDKVNPDERLPQGNLDKRIAPDNEYSDSEEEGEGGRRDQRSYKVRFDINLSLPTFKIVLKGLLVVFHKKITIFFFLIKFWVLLKSLYIFHVFSPLSGGVFTRLLSFEILIKLLI